MNKTILLSLTLCLAASAQVPHIFTSGTPARATEVNANFSALDTSVNTLDAAVSDGLVIVTCGSGEWMPFISNDPVVMQNFSSIARVTRTSTGNNFFSIHPNLPVALNGKVLQLEAVEICYNATDAGTSLVYFEVNAVTQTASGLPTRTILEFDTNDWDDAACRRYTLLSPRLLDTNTSINVFVQGNWTTVSAPLDLGRVTFFLRPTATAASMISADRSSVSPRPVLHVKPALSTTP